MIRKYTPVLYGRNLSGMKFDISRTMGDLWCVVFYTPWFYIGYNVHPNRIQQLIFGTRLG